MHIAIYIIAIVVILYLLLRIIRRTPRENLTAVREKLDRLNAYGDYQDHLIERCTSAPPGNLSIAQQSRLISMAEVNRSLAERCDTIGGIIIRVDDKSLPTERQISIINSSLNNIWNMRNNIDMQLASILNESAISRD